MIEAPIIEIPVSRRKQTIFLLLSCLLNLLLVLFLATHHMNIPDKATLITLIDTQSKTVPDQTQHTPWAARKARSGPLGTPIIMQNPIHQSTSPHTAAIAPQQAATTPYARTTHTEQLDQEEKQQNQSETPAQEPTHDEKHAEQTPEAQTMPIEKFQTTLDQAHPTHKIPQTPNTDHQKNPAHTSPQKQSAAPSAQSLARKMTLADLTQRFLDHSADTDGTSAVTIIGDKSKMPTQDQLKHERYIEKLTACIHNSCSINRQKQPQMENLPSGSMEIFMALNQNGSIQDLHIIRSSGSHHIDAFFVHVFKDAASSFPPVPHYLPHNPYKIAYLIELRMESQSGLRLYRR